MDPGSHRSTDKGLYVAYAQLAQVATEVIGPASQLGAESSWAPDASGIRAGTTEILKNILGERVLGLPKD